MWIRSASLPANAPIGIQIRTLKRGLPSVLRESRLNSNVLSERRTAFVLKGYPRLSETFIAQEIHAVESAGLPLLIVSLRHPTDTKRHPVHEQINAEVLYLPEYLHDEPMRVLKAWWRARKLPGYRTAKAAWLKDLRRDLSRNRVRRFGQALVLAAELPSDVERLHAHFLHTPGSVTRYCARVLDWKASVSSRRGQTYFMGSLFLV